MKSNRWIIPFLFWLIFLRICYSQKPIEYIPSIVMSAGVLFLIMTWIGYSYMDLEDPVSEQLIILKIRSITINIISKMIIPLLVGLLLGVVGVLFPAIQNLLLGNSLFARNLGLSDLIGGILLHCILAVNGAMLGALFHPRIIRNRKSAILMTLTAALIGYTRGILVKEFPFTRFLIWEFPPVYDICESFNGIKYFSMANMALPLLYGVIYCLGIGALQWYLLKKIKF